MITSRRQVHRRPGLGDSLAARVTLAFTLVEMVVVVAVILVLLALVLPAASSLWNERITADAENRLQGILMNARARAARAGGRETGLFFYLDRDGRQHVAPIEQVPPDPGDATGVLTQNLFGFTNDRDEVLPPPMRVVPRYVLDDPTAPGATDATTFGPEELRNQMLETQASGNIDAVQRHRNVFTVIYDREGQLRIGRDVLIRDPINPALAIGGANDVFGDRTRMTVCASPGMCNVARLYYEQGSDNNMTAKIDPAGNRTVPNVIITAGGGNVALNFPSVDGLLLYDDKAYESVGLPLGADPRAFFLTNSQAFLINRLSGEVLVGAFGDGL